MNENNPTVLPLRYAYIFAKENNLGSKAEEIRSMEIEWDRKYGSRLRRGYVIRLFEEHGVYEGFVNQYWPNGLSSDGQARKRRCIQYSYDYDAFLDGVSPDDDGEGESPVNESLEFALEAHLRDFLAKNLSQVEPGLRLYKNDERTGIEFPVEGGRIDILAVDANEKLVVIELKLSQGRNKALGQLLYYMGWVDNNLKQGACRGVIIANEISNELKVAVGRVPGVALCQYRMNFFIENLTKSN